MPFTPRIVIDNPQPGDLAALFGDVWAVTGTVVSIKVTKFEVRCSPIGVGAHTPQSIKIALTKTGNFVAATTYHSFALTANSLVVDLAAVAIDYSSETTISIAEAASGLIGTLIDWSSAFVGCRVEIGDVSIEICESATAPIAYGLGYGEFNNCDEYMAVVSGKLFTENGSHVPEANANTWSTNLIPNTTLISGTWMIWQFANELFLTEPTQGVFKREICAAVTNYALPLYQDYVHPGSNGSASSQIYYPPYLDQVFDHLVDTIALIGSSNIGTVNTTTLDPTTNDPTFKITAGGWANGWIEFEVVFSAAQDWTGVNLAPHLGMHFGTSKTLNGSGDAADGDNANLGFSSDISKYTIRFENAAGANGGVVTATKIGTVSNSSQKDMYAWFDLQTQQSTFPAVMSNIKKIRIKFGVRGSGRPDYYYLKDLIKGGQFHHWDAPVRTLGFADPANDVTSGGALEYAWNYTEGGAPAAAMNARAFTIDDTIALGTRLDPSTPYLGSFINITIPKAPAPFTVAGKINIYRMVNGSYRRIATDFNTDALNFIDRLTDQAIYGDTITYPITALNFDPIDASASGQVTGIINGCEWKGANCYFHTNGNAYISAEEDAKVVFWDGIVVAAGSDSLKVPRTLAIADNRGLPVLVGVGQAGLYMFTRKDGYLLTTTSTPALAGFPRRIAGVRGALGPRAGCRFAGGALFASDDGLWYVEKFDTTTDQPDTLVEMTIRNRRMWKTLIGSGTTRIKTVVRAVGADVWVFCEKRFIHFTRNQQTIYGEWANGKKVIDAHSDPYRGMVVLFEDGTLGVCGTFVTDGGTNLAGDNGQAPSWSWKGKRYTAPAHLVKARLIYENSSAGLAMPAVKIIAFSERGSPSGDSIDFNVTAGVGEIPFDHSIIGSDLVVGGDWWELEIQGGNLDSVKRADVHVTASGSTKMTR